MQRIIYTCFILILVVFGSCSRRPGYVLPEDEMMDVLYDIQIAQAIYRSGNDFDTDEKKDALIEGVLRKHKISQAELDSSLLWYSDNIELYRTINDSVSARLRAQSDLLMASRSGYLSERTNTSYLIPPSFHLNEYIPTMSFDIDSFSIKTIDLAKFIFKFNVQGLSSFQKAEAAIYFTYKDTIVKDIKVIDKNTSYVFTKPNLADSLLKNISGYVHIQNKLKGVPSNVILYNMSYSDSVSVSSNSLEVSDKRDMESESKPARSISVTSLPLEKSTESPNRDRQRIKEIDNTPVISDDKAKQSPLLRKKKGQEIQLKEADPKR